MELTNRQLFILSYLLNHPQRISGEHLASQAGISVRTLQNEIQQINQILAGSIQIDASGKRGYLVSGATDAVREALLSHVSDRQSLYMPEERVNDILTVLLFAKDYTTMETLANTLYLSKASVFRTVEGNYALRKIVSINRVKGLIIDIPEVDKRQTLSKVFDKDAQNPVAQQLRQEYIQLDVLLRMALRNLFIKHRYAVSGESMRSFRRYLIISILRSKHDFPLEQVDNGMEISALMREISSVIRTIIGVSLFESELQDCQARLNNLCTFWGDIPDHRKQWIPELEETYHKFCAVLRQRYGIDFGLEPDARMQFLLHIHKLRQRVQVGYHDSNYHKREINRKYPLAVHLTILAFEECFGFAVPEAEISYLAMYLAMKMRRHFQRIDCIIVTAKHPSVVLPMKQWMEEHFSRHLQSVQIMEHYRFLHSKVRDDVLVLTTGEDVALSCEQAILVKPFRLEEEYHIIDECIQRIRSRCKENYFLAGLDRYVKGIEELDGRKKNLYELLEQLGFSLQPGGQYEFVLDTDTFLLPVVHEGLGSNTIRIYCFPQPVLHRGTELRYLVISEYYSHTMEMRDFYYCLQRLLHPGKLDALRETFS
ncbi:MAG: HTH domain-containing protein [Oscillospiraceae bacterium]|nr:HTH domain-containing protein [Oscillospiraceae bacterium]